MVLNNAQSLIYHVRDLIEVQEILREIREATSINNKKAILSQYRDNENLKEVLKYTYNPNINYGDNVDENIINIKETNTLDDIHSLWYMLAKLSLNNNDDLVKQEFKDYMAFFPDIEELITGIIKKDLNLGISISSINKIIKNLDECFVSDQSSKHKVINIFKYK